MRNFVESDGASDAPHIDHANLLEAGVAMSTQNPGVDIKLCGRDFVPANSQALRLVPAECCHLHSLRVEQVRTWPKPKRGRTWHNQKKGSGTLKALNPACKPHLMRPFYLSQNGQKVSHPSLHNMTIHALQ